jgi:hypothetical protein
VEKMSNPLDKKLLISVGVISAVLFGIGVIIGYYGKQGEYNSRGLSESEKLLINHVTNRRAKHPQLLRKKSKIKSLKK